MWALEDVLQVLDRMGVEAEEIIISRATYAYLIQRAEEVLAAEEEEGEE